MTATDDTLIRLEEQAAIDATLNDRARRLAEVPPVPDASGAIEVLPYGNTADTGRFARRRGAGGAPHIRDMIGKQSGGYL